MRLMRKKQSIKAQLVTKDMKILEDKYYYHVLHVFVTDDQVVILCGKRGTFHGAFKLLRTPEQQVQVKA